MLTRTMLVTVTLTTLLGAFTSPHATATDTAMSSPGTPRPTSMSAYRPPVRNTQPESNDSSALAIVLLGSSLLVGIGIYAASRLQPLPVSAKQRRKANRRDLRREQLRNNDNARASRPNGRIQPTNWR